MDIRTVKTLKQLNDGFYRRCADSFSQTRQSGWAGWEACLPFLRDASRAIAPSRESAGDCKTAAYGDDEPSSPLCEDPGVREAPDPREIDGAEGGSGGAASHSAGERKELAVLDLACGNGRFEAFLAERLADVPVRVLAVDNCDGLMTRARSVGVFRHFDAIEALVKGGSWNRVLDTGCDDATEGDSCDDCCADGVTLDVDGFDAAVSFGFFHHIPSAALREEALRQLLSLVRPGGVVIVSLWCFLEDERLARKAEKSHARVLREMGSFSDGTVCGKVSPQVGNGGRALRQGAAAVSEDPYSGRSADGVPPIDLATQLEPGDRFLGWQDEPGMWRYCHSFDDAEADRLAEATVPLAREVARFRSDGKSGRLNIYQVFRKH